MVGKHTISWSVAGWEVVLVYDISVNWSLEVLEFLVICIQTITMFISDIFFDLQLLVFRYYFLIHFKSKC